ncbi:MAG TPA: ABC transporter permease [Chryseosolibacter sp.]|nr:ABC transporter permease [Chryseosolibacter sp.]
MLKSYLIIAVRFFSRQKGFSIINIFGLTTGIACSLLILLYLDDELSYDDFHQASDRIYRVGFQGNIQGKQTTSTLTGFPVAEVLKGRIDDIESTCRIASWATFPVRHDSLSYTEPYLLLADKNFFRFFSFDLLEGHPDKVLDGNRKVVLSESAARKYFGYKGQGDTTVIGKKLSIAQNYIVEVAGIAKDPPRKSHFHFTIILSLQTWEASENREWLNNKVITYYKLRENVDHEKANQQVAYELRQTLNKELNYLKNTDLDKYQQQGSSLAYIIQPLSEIHLRSDLQDEIEKNGNVEYIYLFASVAAFITFLACINFMNLTTARSASRAKEVAVRKAVGAQNNKLIMQFLLESYFYVVTAVVLAFILVTISLAPFNYFTAKDLSVGSFFNAPFMLGLAVFIIITGCVAGSYPAFYLASFSPIEVLKGNLRARLRTYGIRNILVVFQFLISTVLIIATLVVHQQLLFMQTVDVGFKKENIVNLLHTRNLGRNALAFKEELLSQKDIVIAASYANRLPPNIDWLSVFNRPDDDRDYQLAIYEMDYDHFNTMGYKMAAGRFFSQDENDSSSVILNESAAHILRVKDYDGMELFTNYDQPAGRYREVIGVVKDFNYQSLKNPIQPMAIVLGYQPNWEMAIRVRNIDDNTIATIGKIYTKHADGAPFEFSIVEDNFQLKQEREERIGLLFLGFSVLAIVIACLGLFGLATFTVEQQRKEIGIRKVSGASTRQLLLLLNKGFLLLVLIANLIAWPLSWWLMTLWLNQFAYHIIMPWWTFIVSGVVTFAIAFFSISSKAFSTARQNPVNSLRTE